ncbi:methyl-accepting chemotaxis protein [Cohnella endophytica]|uniref:Methyl-accepting chemotaxis protein n=1 Tax=Cohnella endophytica TaxID=2419778 RepID=A0A494XTW0_9BACL|nr:methyl-accepting chemotaxis protein [Cohnella endophytica]RKP51564.1 methyl-accepting chemotaxis protein [Cohnella endophytica]
MDLSNKYKLIGKLTIGKKLVGSFLVIAVLLAITGGIASYYLKKIDVSSTDLIERRAVILSNMLKIQVEVSKESSSLRGYIINQDADFLERLNRAYDNATRLIEETHELARIAEFKEQLHELEAKNQEFKQKYEQLIGMIQEHQSVTRTTEYFMSEVLPLGRQLDPIADKLAEYQLNSMNEASKKNNTIVDTAVTNVATLTILAFILAIAIGYFISRVISKPIVAIAEVAERIASGDLTAKDVTLKRKDEIGLLAVSFKQMTDNLRNLVRQISMSSEHVASSSEELTASAEQSSQTSETITLNIQGVTGNAEMQSQNVGESVQAMNEMSSGVQQIASNALMTSALSIETAQKAMEGNQTIQLTVKQMDAIHQTMNHLAKAVTEMEQRSDEIEQMVELISEIAAQTNLLSLNAAIEAARAGEQGHGFAVVATEVRKLAEQSAQSAGQIAEVVATIKNSTQLVVKSTELGVKEVSEGIQAVHAAGKLFGEIKINIDEVSDQVQEISAASQQISASTEQVVHSIENISEGSKNVAEESKKIAASTEEQLASMEEIASSASSLSRMAEELRDIVARFKV